uniref:Uncharacterized protein n=1 Tax=viral metagenome TaxID=1070528 RepID=A0A6H1ZEW5_9ZZZZ
MKKITCKYCGEEFEEETDFGGNKRSAEEVMEDSEEHLCSACGNSQDYESCRKLDGVCIECFEE